MKIAAAAVYCSSMLFASMGHAADTANGLRIAQERCARCHNIEAGGAFKLRPPSFQSIAIYRTPEDIWARILVPAQHSGMPDTMWVLLPEEIQDVTAYVASLDRPITLQQ
jgi:mono/diheme cytochrome c family protein